MTVVNGRCRPSPKWCARAVGYFQGIWEGRSTAPRYTLPDASALPLSDSLVAHYTFCVPSSFFYLRDAYAPAAARGTCFTEGRAAWRNSARRRPPREHPLATSTLLRLVLMVARRGFRGGTLIASRGASAR